MDAVTSMIETSQLIVAAGLLVVVGVVAARAVRVKLYERRVARMPWLKRMA